MLSCKQDANPGDRFCYHTINIRLLCLLVKADIIGFMKLEKGKEEDMNEEVFDYIDSVEAVIPPKNKRSQK